MSIVSLEKLRHQLSDPRSFVGESQMRQIAHQVFRRREALAFNVFYGEALEKYLADYEQSLKEECLTLRMSGEANDIRSSEFGFRLYLSEGGYTSLKEQNALFGLVIPGHKFLQMDCGVYAAEFPEGVFDMSYGPQFYQNHHVVGDKYCVGDDLFSASYSNVCRVEGFNGELWQNKLFSWDFNPKEL